MCRLARYAHLFHQHRQREYEMKYIINKSVSAKSIADLRQSVGWNRMESAYNNPLMTSYLHISVYDKDKLIGYIESVSNGITDAYIQDLMVHPDYQGQGIGTELMNKMIALLKERGIFMISVIYEESLKPFYEKFGFFSMLAGQMQTYD